MEFIIFSTQEQHLHPLFNLTAEIMGLKQTKPLVLTESASATKITVVI